MKISNFTGAKFGFLGAAILGTSILLSGCKKNYSEQELLEKIELASNNSNTEELLNILNHRDYSFDDVLQKLVKILYDRDRHYIAKACIVDAFGNMGQSAKEVTFHLIYVLKKYEGSFVGKKALQSIVKIHKQDEEKLVQILIELLNDTSLYSREYFVPELSKLGQKAKNAEEPMINILLNDCNKYLRKEVATALGEIGLGSKKSISALINAMKNDADDEVKDAASKSLTKIAPSSIQPLIELFKEQKGMEIFLAIRGVGPKAIPHLLNELEKRQEPVNKTNIILLLGDLGSKTNDETEKSKVASVLINALKDKNKYVRLNAATGLWLIGPNTKEAIDALTGVSRSDRDEDVRNRAQDALDKIRKTE